MQNTTVAQTITNFTVQDIQKWCLPGTSWMVTVGKDSFAFMLPQKFWVHRCDAAKDPTDPDVDIVSIDHDRIQVVQIGGSGRDPKDGTSFICIPRTSTLQQITAEQFKALQLLVTSKKNT